MDRNGARAGSGLLRLIDANANRAREGARVLEDLARFVLDARELSAALRDVRHGVDRTVRGLPFASALPAARDSERDVGREGYPGSRPARASLREMATANAKRLEEALRSLEEAVRRAGEARSASAFQALRFGVYRLEKDLTRALPPEPGLPDPCLYVIVTEAVARGPWEKAARAALEGGAAALQLREKDLPDREFARRAERLGRLAKRIGALFFVNDRVHVAHAVGADGVHLGPEDLAVPAARAILGPDAIVGATAHTVAEAEARIAEGAAYVSMGPVFSAATKYRHLEARGIEVPVLAPTGLASVRRIAMRRLPFVAIGGIGPENARSVVRAGARRIAVCAGVIGAADPCAAARSIARALHCKPRGRAV